MWNVAKYSNRVVMHVYCLTASQKQRIAKVWYHFSNNKWPHYSHRRWRVLQQNVITAVIQLNWHRQVPSKTTVELPVSEQH